jgi:HD-like signal output (HDOD) protein
MENNLTREKTIAHSIAQEILQSGIDIPPIPANGQKIMEIVRQPIDRIDVPYFVRLLESDPSLFTKILRLANSPFYRETEKIVSLRAAITRIGLTETVNSACFHFFQELLPRFPDIEGLTYDAFWSRSWVCAVVNRRLGHPNLDMGVLPGDLYLTGMLHGLGKLLLAIYLPKEFSRCIHTALKQEIPLFEIEKKVFGTTSAMVASNIMRTWELPEHICEGVAFHQIPELAPPDSVLMAALTQFACALAELTHVGSNGDGQNLALADTFLGQKPSVKLSDPQIQTQLIQETITALKDRVDGRIDTTNQLPKPARPASDVDMRVHKRHPDPVKPRKKGIMGWIKSLFS